MIKKRAKYKGNSQSFDEMQAKEIVFLSKIKLLNFLEVLSLNFNTFNHSLELFGKAGTSRFFRYQI